MLFLLWYYKWIIAFLLAVLVAVLLFLCVLPNRCDKKVDDEADKSA
jgi:hypothetical protein